MKKIIAFIIILVLIIVLGFYFKNNKSDTKVENTEQTSLDTNNASSDSVIINIKNFAFNPSTMNVKAGTKITWVNNDLVSHTVTSDRGDLLDSPTLSPGDSFSFTFNDAGTVNYHCNIHKTMKGSIVVSK